MQDQSKPMAGHTLYRGEGNNSLVTILSPAAHETVKEMYARAKAGEDWTDIHASTPQPTGIYVFCPDDWWNHEIGQVATGTMSDLETWLAHFTAQGGTVRRSETGSNNVPLSNQHYITYEPGNRGADDYYPRPDIEVLVAFGITADMLRERPKVKEPALSR